MSSTKPPGPKTGLVTVGCYAAALKDCDGKPPTREHYVSECILERIPSVRIAGLAWQQGEKPKPVPTSAYAANVLCARHNRALYETDKAMCRLYDALVAFHDGKPVGWLEIDGEDLERWAMKTLFALINSGNVTFAEGVENDRPAPLEKDLRVLFGDNDVPESGGLFGIREQTPELVDYKNELTLRPMVYPAGDERAGKVAGITAHVLGFGFYATFNVPFLDSVLSHRLLGVAFGERGNQGCVAFRWKHSGSDEVLVLRPAEPAAIAP